MMLEDEDIYERFVPVDEAAERMNTTPENVVKAVEHGALRATRAFGELMIEPAITNWRG
ncbi:hypothetical protein ACIG56_30025 [Nocardia fusca]|uniref:hypothetical protein n=1 Tax=Nocardia fusca TaxID=941183 RepID=UPI0037C70FF0